MPKFLKLTNRGDTIVEVMIVLAVLGLAIGISYATANRSLLNARQAQENSAATGIAQSQVEALRSLSADPFQEIFILGEPFCTVHTNDAEHPYNILPVGGGSCALTYGGGVSYKISITRSDAVGDPDTFTVQITWPDVSGQGDDTVTQVYRVHKP